ncbi:N/A [soil metagenome]
MPDLTAGRAKTPSLRMALRAATAVDHEAVDAAFSRFDLTSLESYTQFLLAHARALGPLETAVAGIWSASRERYPLLASDLADLGVESSSDGALVLSGEAAAWGVIYVLEGSRLGGSILAKCVADGLPVRYLSAAHEDGSWRQFAEALELAGGSEGGAWRDAAISGAKSAFARFAKAAAL